MVLNSNYILCKTRYRPFDGRRYMIKWLIGDEIRWLIVPKCDTIDEHILTVKRLMKEHSIHRYNDVAIISIDYEVANALESKEI